ncbi:fumarylacetoacetate hydrolase family protein [Rhodococcoides yunnanense]|uniref:fumarylacetoacetate hydrolase family protein n=1 Tax=Rhodococcoides yunnanense TaxID=278209 RepID=UPI0009348028|nr:fumarylacetoacetate hydrolase family protein [Rhodococcus yunnanensis]
MKLVSFGSVGIERPGVLQGGQILDVCAALARRGHFGIHTMIDLISLPHWQEILKVLIDECLPRDWVDASGVRLGAPVPRPGKVIVIGANTYSHVAEAALVSNNEPPLEVMALAKAGTAVVGPNDDVVRPDGARTLDYEVELGVIIGQAVRNIPESRALEAVAGYTSVNEMSDRDMQTSSHETNSFYRTHFLGKSYDGFCPAGPALVTLDEMGEPGDTRLRTWVNDELRQDDTLLDLVFPVERIVSYLSKVMTLLPGDLICTGSPAGVGAFREPLGYLEPGDTVRTDITGIGGTANLITTLETLEPV